MFGKRLTKQYLKDDTGQIAVITAVVAVPLMLGVSIALDSHMTDRARVQLQASLDNAAIAAISDQTITTAQRSEHAKERFWANMSDEHKVKFNVLSSEEKRLELQAEMEIPTLFAGIIGRETIAVAGTAVAEVTKGRTVCMMALDPDSPKSFEMDFGGQLDANCAVQEFLGTVYLPSHRIEFVQGSGSVTHAPATSFIAHQIKITDDANIAVSADHVAAGISPIKPRSDDGARLSR